MNQPVYINGAGKFLPGEPVINDAMEDYLGRIFGKPSALRKRVLQRNGIQTRHYAIDKNQKSLFRNSEMAARACLDVLDRCGFDQGKVDLLACATTQGDLLVPGFASMVHGDLGNPPCEVVSIAGVCASGLMAIKHAYLQLASGNSVNAIACASEMPSRLFKASRYEVQQDTQEKGRLPFDTEFLRWMLSDGAGALLMATEPNVRGLSLRVDWIKLRSHADSEDVCMYSGAASSALEQTWLDYRDFDSACAAGLLNLKQDTTRLDGLLQRGMAFFLDLIEEKAIDPTGIDWLLAHYSSEKFRHDILAELKKLGISIPEEKWFSNLATRGNTGSASIFLMLEELINDQKLKPGETILCMVPESGRFTIGFMQLTVVGTESEPPKTRERPIISDLEPTSSYQIGDGEFARGLARVWLDFEERLKNIPLVKAIETGRLTKEQYSALLLNWRQQVIEGGRWITRAASSIASEYADLRSLFIHHAKDEHMDFKLLEENYRELGGRLEDIKNYEINVGSEALSAFIMYRATLPNPFDLMGAMFIIEGLGKNKAKRWGRMIQDQLNLPDAAVSFFLYHGDNDDNHLERLQEAMEVISPDKALQDRIIKTARTTSRLYCLQLEEIR